jgi:tetratricopeptide (TPR) repeat protein
VCTPLATVNAGGEAMADADRHDTDNTTNDGEQPQVPATTSNTASAGLVTGLVQAGVITGGIHHHLPAPRPPVSTPHQLSSAPAGFVGRVDQLAALDRALAAPGGCSPQDGGCGIGATAVLSAIGGTGGIGKTWLALTWSNRNLHRFPDGQLSVDLRGFSPGDPKPAADVLADFLAALGVDRDHQPTDPDARAALYRTHTTGKRLLILLDNAATPDQVVPLLPGGTSCAVLVTSRNRLPALLTRHGARPVNVDVLTHTEARTLLNDALGDAHATAAAQQAVTDLIALCKGFPLALGLIAARIRTHPDLLDDVVSELRALGLGALDSDDPDVSLPMVLSWSLRRLTDRQRTAFGLLGIAPGPDIDLLAAASLTGLPERDTRTVLHGLADASLITHASGDRYSMHDLVRDYATTTAHDNLSEPVRREALKRAVDFYLHTAYHGDRFIDRTSAAIKLVPPTAGCTPTIFDGIDAALAWFAAELTNIQAVRTVAEEQGWDTAVWQLARAVGAFCVRRGLRADIIAFWSAAIRAARRLNDLATQALAHRYLGRTYTRLGQHTEALNHLNTALTLATEIADTAEQADIHRGLAWAYGDQDKIPQSLVHAHHAIQLYQTLGNQPLKGESLVALGHYQARAGQRDDAAASLRQALDLCTQHRHLHGQADALDALGRLAHDSGRHAQALRYHHQALALYREIGSTSEEAGVLERLGHTNTALGQHAQAHAVWHEALELYRQQGRDPDAERVQRHLDTLGSADSHK